MCFENKAFVEVLCLGGLGIIIYRSLVGPFYLFVNLRHEEVHVGLKGSLCFHSILSVNFLLCFPHNSKKKGCFTIKSYHFGEMFISSSLLPSKASYQNYCRIQRPSYSWEGPWSGLWLPLLPFSLLVTVFSSCNLCYTTKMSSIFPLQNLCIFSKAFFFHLLASLALPSTHFIHYSTVICPEISSLTFSM